MRRPRIAEGSLGAVIGALVGFIGVSVAVVLPLAILTHKICALSAARSLGILGFLVSSPLGWFLGGQVGPRLAEKLGERKGRIFVGIVAGWVPITGFAAWGWYLTQPK